MDIEYDPSVITFEDLLDVFWKNHSPTVQKSRQYMSAVFCHGDEQLRAAQRTKKEQEGAKGAIYTTVEMAERFYDAEE